MFKQVSGSGEPVFNPAAPKWKTRWATGRFRSLLAASILFTGGLMGGCGGSSSLGSSAPPAPGEQVVGVAGTQMTLNGAPWLSRGVALQGYVRPLSLLRAEAPTDTQAASLLKARLSYGTAELSAIQNYHADTIRYQISQPALDPDSSLYDPQYFDDVVNAIKMARSSGFVVMVMMQDEMITGDSGQDPLPTMETQNDWDLFATAFGSDRGVIFELYNEPGLTASAAHWQLWLNGGLFKGQSYLGMQTLVNHIRSNGALNVLVVDGLGVEIVDPLNSHQKITEAAATLESVLPITDALDRIVYAVHPYQHGISDESSWNAEFGQPSTMLPVWADEWSAPTQLALGLGNLPDYHVAVDFLNYARLHFIPICTGAFDVTRFAVQNVAPWTPNNYDNYSDTSMTEGSGTLVYNDFMSNYSRQLTKADGQ